MTKDSEHVVDYAKDVYTEYRILNRRAFFMQSCRPRWHTKKIPLKVRNMQQKWKISLSNSKLQHARKYWATSAFSQNHPRKWCRSRAATDFVGDIRSCTYLSEYMFHAVLSLTREIKVVTHSNKAKFRSHQNKVISIEAKFCKKRLQANVPKVMKTFQASFSSHCRCVDHVPEGGRLYKKSSLRRHSLWLQYLLSAAEHVPL